MRPTCPTTLFDETALHRNAAARRGLVLSIDTIGDNATVGHLGKGLEMTTTGIVCCVLGVLFGVAGATMAKRQPNRITNGLLFVASFALLLDGLLFLLWNPGDTPMWVTIMFMIVFYTKHLLFLAVGLGFIANAFVTVRREGLSLAHVLPLGCGVMLLVSTYWFLLGPGMGQTGSELSTDVMDFLGILISFVPLALIGVWVSNDICYKSRKAPETEYVIVLGCGIRKDGTVTPLLQGRLDAAIKAYEAGGRRAKIITSGGQGADEVTSEARAMANYLLSQGIPEEDILLEDKSTTTEENLAFSRKIMEGRGGATHCTIATSSYHSLRAAMFARRAGLDVSCAGGHTAAFFYPAAFFREYAALVLSNRYAIGAFFALAIVRFALLKCGVMPASLF